MFYKTEFDGISPTFYQASTTVGSVNTGLKRCYLQLQQQSTKQSNDLLPLPSRFGNHQIPQRSQSDTIRFRRSISEEEKVKRKAVHNEIEKRRRTVINDKIYQLSQLLPMSDVPDSKRNKGIVLSRAIDYISQLQQMEQNVNALKMENNHLLKLNQQAQQQLSFINPRMEQFQY